MDNAFIRDRINTTKQLIIKHEDASIALSDGSIQSYTLDTGQSTQTVTKLNLGELQKVIDSLYNRCTTLQTRLTGSGQVIGKPSW